MTLKGTGRRYCIDCATNISRPRGANPMPHTLVLCPSCWRARQPTIDEVHVLRLLAGDPVPLATQAERVEAIRRMESRGVGVYAGSARLGVSGTTYKRIIQEGRSA